MTSIDELRGELEEEEKIRKGRYLAKERAAQGEEILQLRTIKFERPILKNELKKQLIPYLRRNSEEVRFVQDPMEGRVICGHLAKRRSILDFRLNPRYDGLDRRVYDSIEFYPKKGRPLTNAIVQGMRETNENVRTYFERAGVTGRELQKPKFPPL